MSSSGKRRKIDNNRTKKEAEKKTDEKKATKLNQRKIKVRVLVGATYPHSDPNPIYQQQSK